MAAKQSQDMQWHCFEPLAGATLEVARLLRNFALSFAGVAELADALDSKSSDRKIVWVRSPPPAARFSIVKL